MGRPDAKKRSRIRWRRVAAVVAAFFFTGLAFAYWMLVALDVNRFKPHIVAVVKAATGRELTVGGDIQVQIGLRPTLAVEDIRFQNAAWGSRRDMLRLRRLEFQIAAWPLLFGNFDVRRIVLVEPELLLETATDGRWNLPQLVTAGAAEPPPAASPYGGWLQHMTFAAARIEGGRLAWRSARRGKPLTMSIKTVRGGMADLNSPIRFTMEAVYEGQPIQASGSIGRLFRLLDDTRKWPLDVALTSGALQATVSGAIQSVGTGQGLDLAVQVRGDSLTDVERFAPALPLPIEGRFFAGFRLTDPKAGRLRFSDLRASVGDSDLSGWIEIQTRGPRPRVVADLRAKNIAIESRPMRATRSESNRDPGRVFPDEPIDFNPLRKVDAQVHLVADRLQSPLLAAEGIDVNLEIKDGEASLRPLMIQMGGGYAEGRVNIRPASKGGWVSLRLTARELPVERVLTLFTRVPLLVGKMDANIQLLGRGGSVSELMAGLDGNIFWMMGKGQIRTRHIDRLAGETAGGLVRLLGPGSEKKKTTDLNCLVAEIEIERGVARCRGLLLDTEETTIAGKGEIDLSSEAIDITMDPSPKRGLPGLTLSLGELGNPFKLGGTLASPQVTLDTAGAAITIGKAFGGFTLAGPFGLVAALADFSSAGTNPCLKTIEKFKKENAERIKP